MESKNRSMSRKKVLLFSLIPAFVFLFLLELTGRFIYPFDPDARAQIKAQRDPRSALSYLGTNATEAAQILKDIHRTESQYLPFLGWLGVPHQILPTIETNELGFRDRDFIPRQTDEFRIVILGGSAAWGLGATSNNATVTGALESILNSDAPFEKYTVINGVYSGWYSRHELIALMEFYDVLIQI